MLSKNRHKILLYLCCLFLVSIVYSKFLLSVSMMGLFGFSVYFFRQKQLNYRDFLKSKYLVGLMLFFFMILLSGINSENMIEWGHQLKMKLPYLIMPFSLWVFKDEVIKYYHVFHQAFILIIFASTFLVYYNIFSDYEAHLAALGVGHSAETPVDHIKYSIFLAFAALSSLVFLVQKKPAIGLDLPKWFYAITLLVIFVLLHVLAVRSGLVLFYLVLFICAFILIVKSKNYAWLMVLFLFVVGSPFVMYKTMPSIQAKVGYMKYDFNEYLKGGGSKYSDSERWVSIQSGLKLFRESILLGTGIGDLREANSQLMSEKLGYYPDKYPHNQFIFYLSGMGLIGFILFCLGFFRPWALFQAGEMLFILLSLLVFFSFLVENTLERSYSIAFFCFYYGIGIIKSRDIVAKKA